MREIKFRAWDQDRKKMAMDVHKEYDTITGVRFADGGEPGEECFNSYLTRRSYPDESHDRYFVMQYTGLKDKNGKEIYEGDILERRERAKHRANVIFGVSCWWCQFDPTGTTLGKFLDPSPTGSARADVKVIGNIYENPKLSP